MSRLALHSRFVRTRLAATGLAVLAMSAGVATLSLPVSTPAATTQNVAAAPAVLRSSGGHAATTAAAAPGSTSVWTTDGQVMRWNPCRTITYRINGAQAGGITSPEISQVFARLTATTGMTFKYLGPTTAIPTKTWLGGKWPSDADVVIAWAKPGVGAGRSNILTANSNVAAYGGWTSTGSYNAAGKVVWQINHGYVVLDANKRTSFRPGFGTGSRRGTLLMHELGHVVGVQHMNTKTQTMYPSIGAYSLGVYGSSDKAALRTVGKTSGCISTK